jgi:hypothetical protein
LELLCGSGRPFAWNLAREVNGNTVFIVLAFSVAAMIIPRTYKSGLFRVVEGAGPVKPRQPPNETIRNRRGMVPMPAREVYFEGAMKRVVQFGTFMDVLSLSTFAVIAEVFLCLFFVNCCSS